MLKKKLPSVSHTYQHHHLDSTRWNAFSPRDGDVIVASSIKSGTTWTQWIAVKLLLSDLNPKSLLDIAPWLDWRTDQQQDPLQDLIALLEAQPHRRIIKTHLPLDGLPYFPQVRYVVLGRDGRDVAMSLWNHYGNYSDELLALLNSHEGVSFPRRPETFHEFWADWINKGWFDWEQDGYPFWSHFHFIQSWWDFKHLPNILFVHFADLLTDLTGEIQRIADHLGVTLSATRRSEVAEEVTFENMKKEAKKYAPLFDGEFKGGPEAFFHKGNNGRWKHVLTDQEIAQYESAVARTLAPECAAWLEFGKNEL